MKTKFDMKTKSVILSVMAWAVSALMVTAVACTNIIENFNQFVEKLQVIVQHLKSSDGELSENGEKLSGSVSEVCMAIEEIIAEIKKLNNGFASQSECVAQTSQAVNKISSTIVNGYNGIFGSESLIETH